MHRHVLREIGRSPITVPCGAVVVLLLALAQSNGGEAVTTWAPFALFVIALLILSTLLLGGGWSSAPWTVRAATVALGGFTAWSFASILWADDQAAAWDGANRTLLYLVVFMLFALWRQASGAGSALLTAWTLGMIVLAVAAMLRIPGANPASLFIETQLDEPTGYPNAAACMWLMALWPAIAMAANPRNHFLLRGLLAGGAVVLLDVALLSLSRGALFAVPLSAVLFFACFGPRLRHFAVALPVAAGAAVAIPTVLDVGDAVFDDIDAAGRVDAMVTIVVLAALAVMVVVAIVAWFESSREHQPSTVTLVRRGTAALAITTIAAIVVVGAVAVRNPVDRVNNAWESFSAEPITEADGGSRLVAGLWSGRHDAYRVSINLFRENPLKGIGVDNFSAEYLRHGRSDATPRYPHSVEFRTAAQTGIVGIALLGAFLVFAVMAVASVRRSGDVLAVSVTSGAAMVFAYWFIHGSVDWFWEFAGLGAPAFAFLGLACGLAPRAQQERVAVPWARGAKVLGVAGLGIGLVSIALPWLAERNVERAVAVFDERPFEAYQRLDRAKSLNPLSERPAVVAGSIALRYNDLERADAEFADALERVGNDQYATLMRGAIASLRDRDESLALLNRAVALAPFDPVAKQVRDVVRDGGQVDIANLTRLILGRATALNR